MPHSRTKRSLVVLLALALLPLVPAAQAAEPSKCDGGVAPPTKEPVHTFAGRFDASLEGAHVMVPFTVPGQVTRVQLRLCYERARTNAGAFEIKNTLDLGVYEARRGKAWGPEEFRGWGGSSRPEVVITPQGHNDEAVDRPADGASTTVGYLPGEIPAGRWAAEIGVAAVVKPHEGNPSGQVPWRLDIYFGSDLADADEPWRPARYDPKPAKTEAGWYKGDFHVHARHSHPDDALMSRVFNYAFGTAGLDFITLSDYVSPRSWDEIGRYQGVNIPEDKLVIRSSEVITYRGHMNNHASLRYVDHRTGPVYELKPNGELRKVRDARPASGVFDDIHRSGLGWTQINHPTIFPAKVPGFANFCRGCSWDYSDAETDWSKVDAFEVQTGPAGLFDPKRNEPGPNPFTPAAIEWWDRLRRDGFRITAVGSSDSHKAGEESLTRSPIGEATTVVYAQELSEQGIRDGILAGHAYVKFFSPDGPDLRFTAKTADGREAMMGDELAASAAEMTATVRGGLPTPESPQLRTLFVYWEGIPVLVVPVLQDPFELIFPAPMPGNWRLQLQRGTAYEALTNPITLSP